MPLPLQLLLLLSVRVVILGYWQNGNNTFPMPYTYLLVANIYQVSFIPYVGRVMFYLANLSVPGTVSTPNGSMRYILIPGGVAGGRGTNSEKMADINGRIYTESQLKDMSYQQVCSLLRIAQ